MADKLETTLRGPEAYGLARRVIEAMEAAGVWPTPLNFEIWVHYLGKSTGPGNQSHSGCLGTLHRGYSRDSRG
jgi:hypothetical protein